MLDCLLIRSIWDNLAVDVDGVTLGSRVTDRRHIVVNSVVQSVDARVVRVSHRLQVGEARVCGMRPVGFPIEGPPLMPRPAGIDGG